MDSLGEDRMWCKNSFGSQSLRGLVYCLKLTELTEKHNQNEVCDKQSQCYLVEIP